MNDVGEPDAGEPHVRFDRGPLARGPRTVRMGTTRKPRPSVSTHGPDQQPAAYLTEVSAGVARPEGSRTVNRC